MPTAQQQRCKWSCRGDDEKAERDGGTLLNTERVSGSTPADMHGQLSPWSLGVADDTKL